MRACHFFFFFVDINYLFVGRHSGVGIIMVALHFWDQGSVSVEFLLVLPHSPKHAGVN